MISNLLLAGERPGPFNPEPAVPGCAFLTERLNSFPFMLQIVVSLSRLLLSPRIMLTFFRAVA